MFVQHVVENLVLAKTSSNFFDIEETSFLVKYKKKKSGISLLGSKIRYFKIKFLFLNTLYCNYAFNLYFLLDRIYDIISFVHKRTFITVLVLMFVSTFTTGSFSCA